MSNVIRVQKNSNYVVMNKESLNDKRLSWKAKGLHAFMLSKPNDWVFLDTELEKHAKDGKDSLKSALKELKEHGYMRRVRHRDESGRFTWETIVYEVPYTENPLVEKPSVEKPSVEKPSMDLPSMENPQLLNNDLLNNDKLNNDLLKNNQSINHKEQEIQKLELPIVIKKQMLKEIDRLIDDDINIFDIETVYHAVKEVVNEFQFVDILGTVLRETKEKIRNIKSLLHTAIKKYMQDMQEKIKKLDKQGKQGNKRTASLPKWMTAEIPPKSSEVASDYEKQKKALEDRLKQYSRSKESKFT